MTRETKIGLLVGLAFIIVIGILLSDHLTSSNEPPPATLAQAGSNVRQALSTPATNTPPPITAVVTPPQVQPQAPVPTGRDLVPQPPATAIVQISGPGAQQPQPVAPISVSADAAQAQPQSQAPVVTGVASADMPANISVPPDLARVAQQHNEPLVSVTPGSQQQPATPFNWSQALTGSREYTAQPGDSVSRMAARFLGANTKANRDAIIRANPALQPDPNKVIVGKTYRIPASGDAAPPPAAPQRSAVAQASGTEYWYTVKEGDSLWRIASEQLGSGGSGVAAIKELNKDILKGSDVVHPNMKLRLPGKPVARAN